MKNDCSLSLLIPALNEEPYIRPTVIEAIQAVERYFEKYEVILIDDGSRDRTGAIMDELARTHKNVRVIHNETNLGLGLTYQKGIAAAQHDYLAWISGDGGMLSQSWPAMLERVGTADIVTSYIVNLGEAKSGLRYLLSVCYTRLMRMLSGRKLKYFNGPCVHRVDLLRTIQIYSPGFGVHSEILVKLLREGHSCVEVGIQCRRDVNSTTLKLRNILRVLRTIYHLISVRLGGRSGAARRRADVDAS